MTSRRFILMGLLANGLSGCDALPRIGGWQSEPISDSKGDELQAANEDIRPRVAEITSLAVEDVTAGAIVLATALPVTQGWFKPELVNDAPNGKPVDGVLSYSFRAVPPRETQPQSTQRSRVLTVALFIPDARLANVRSIRVNGAQNSKSVRP